MSYVWLIVAFGAGLLIARHPKWREIVALLFPPAPAQPASTSHAVSLSAEPMHAPSTPPAPDTPIVRLRKLCNELTILTDKTSHSREIADEPQFREMVAIMTPEEFPLDRIADYAFGTSWPHSCAALAALSKRADGHTLADEVVKHFGGYGIWQMAFALDYIAGLDGQVAPGAVLKHWASWWDNQLILRREFEIYFTKLDEMKVAPDLAVSFDEHPSLVEPLRGFLRVIGTPYAKRLEELLPAEPKLLSDTSQTNQPHQPEPSPSEQSGDAFLASIGRFWTPPTGIDKPLEPEAWREGLAAARTAIDRKPIRSLLVTGDPLSGKTSFLKLLAGRLEKDGWRVFEAGAADLQAGQQYIGQLEARIRQALDELAVSKKIIWYVPDILGMALSGSHQSQSATIIDQLMAAIASGRLVIWAEATRTSAARLMQFRPALRRNFETVRLEPLDAEETKPLAAALSKALEGEFKISIDASFAETAIDAAQHYLSASCLPGAALSLMRVSVLRMAEAKGRRLAGRDVLDTLSQLTGLPRSILDGSEKIDLSEIRKFFASRVIGQDEAVSVIVERIAMLKSGLNDPGKPLGVFLFAGPTGTGKTELAKAIADYLFGSVDRMIRLDMSEYQAPDSIIKITGGPALGPDADTLIARVRKQPFSLILFDEFEKSNSSIWDLCLQMFDEGRLTDTNGQTADFRHCLIILTTNLGATSHQSSGLGFQPKQSVYTSEQVLRAVGQTFRPEFQNRLDNVIVFKPLTRELMRGILTKELGRLYERRGLKDRGWAVEWEASALEFLLEKGFSPDMGARPLKRAIDQHVVAPLAAAIVERRTPEGEQFVFVRSDGTAIQAEFVDPDGDGEPYKPPANVAANGSATPTAPTLAGIMLAPEGSTAEIDALAAANEAIATRLTDPAWDAEKSRLSQAINQPEFWSRRDRSTVLSRYELMDRLMVAADTAASLQARFARSRKQPGPTGRELIARLAMQVMLVEEGLKDLDEAAPTEAAVLIEPALEIAVAERGAHARWHRELLDMYRAWARLRNMQLAELEPLTEAGLPLLVIGGFGAHRTLVRETGLHVLELGEAASGHTRAAARVLIAPVPGSAVSKAQIRRELADIFTKQPRGSTVVRRYRREPSPLVRNADGSWRTGRLDAVLAGNFDIMQGEGA